MWSKVFYDKYAGDHHFDNVITKNISIDDLEDGSYNLKMGEEALNLYNLKFNSGNYKLPEFLLNTSMYGINIYDKVIDGIETMFVVILINSNKLRSCIKNNKEIPNISFIKQLCRFHICYTDFDRAIKSCYSNTTTVDTISSNLKFITEKSLTPIDYTFHKPIDNQDDITVELYKYQQCNIKWMLDKETNKKTINYNMNKIINIGDTYFDMYTQTFNLLEDKDNLTFYGGGIIDEVGLGKTIQVITTAIKNPCKNISYVRKEDKSHLYSRATLIICPNQLCKQWERELLNMVSKDYSPTIYTFLTKRQFDKYTYQDILDADFVLVSSTFLDNKVFTLPWSSKINNLKSFSRSVWTKDDISKVKKQFEIMGSKLVENPFSTLELSQPFFQLINWHRIVIDEFHEIHSSVKYRHLYNLIPHIRASNKWIVTATPFIDADSLYHSFNFLTDYQNIEGTAILANSDFVDYLSTNCFRRNTKESVAKEHTIPPIEEEIKWLNFTTTERMMYNAYLANPNNSKFSVYLRQLCCHPQLADETKLALSNCKTLVDIEKMMLSHYKKDVDVAKLKVSMIEKRIRRINRKIRDLKKRQVKKMNKKLIRIRNAANINFNMSDDESDSDLEDELELNIEVFDDELEDESDKEDEQKVTDDITNYDIEIKDLERQGMAMDAVITLNNYKENLTRCMDILGPSNKELEGKITTFNFFNNVIERLRNTANKDTLEKRSKKDITKSTVEELFNISDSDSEEDDEEKNDICSICLDNISEDDVGVTKCGHIFCYECLKLSTSKYRKCSYCNMKLSEKEIFMLSYTRKKQKLSLKEKQNEDFINEVGTKIANLIFFLRDNNNHSIIFSQWDSLLRRVGKILEENGIKNVFCRGNCYQRDKAIREFNQDDKIKVIMLSSDSAASGTNLTKASQVILLDPMYGDYKYRKDQEAQAIGRAHRLGQKNKIKVIRLIVKNSIEEDIYWMNTNEDKDREIVKEVIKTNT